MRRIWSYVVGVFFLIASVTAQDAAIPTTSHPNDSIATVYATKHVTATSDAPACCFLVQDTVTEVWAEIYYTLTFYQVVNKTSLTVRVTPFSDSTVTNIETNVYTTNATFSTPVPTGQNPISLFANDAPGAVETSIRYSSSQIVTAGVTIASPQAAYIYTSLKIITVAPVTDSKGELVCGTDFSFPTTTLQQVNGSVSTKTATGIDSDRVSSQDATYSNMNSNAQAYFGGYGIMGTSTSAFATHTTTVMWTYADSEAMPTSTMTFIGTNTEVVTFYINSKFESVDINIPKQTGFTLTFEPFVYQPESGKLGKTGDGSTGCQFSTGTEGYGYPPQTLLDSLIANPTISSKYPGLASCIPAGPSLIHPSECIAVAPAFQPAGGDLTDSIVITIDPTAQPVSEEPTSVKTTAAPPVQTTPPAGTSATVVAPPVATTAPQAPTNTPSNPDAAIASGIASIIGAAPLPSPTHISGTTEIIISAYTTIPYNPFSPVPGLTTLINGETQIIIASATTVPLTQVLDDLPGSTIMVSGTMEVVFTGPTTVPVNPELPGLTGETGVWEGTTWVVVEGPTTVPVVLGTPSGAAGGIANPSAPPSKASRNGSVKAGVVGVLFGIMVMVW